MTKISSLDVLVETLSPTPVLPTATQAVLPAPESTTSSVTQPITFPIAQSTLEEVPSTVPSAVPSSTVLPSIEPTRISSRSGKGIPPKRLQDEQVGQTIKEREKRENKKRNRRYRRIALAKHTRFSVVYHVNS